MPKAAAIQLSFNSGELSQYMASRIDNGKYASGCSIMENFFPIPAGPATRRPGSRFIGERKGGLSRAIPFTFSIDQNYVLEFGVGYLRFWRNRAQLLSAGIPYEIVTPFNGDDIFQMRFVQSADVLYLACGRLPVQKLTRVADTNWTIAEVDFQLGPLGDQNSNQANRIYYSDANAVPGTAGNTVTLTSMFAFFNASMVGQLLELEWETRPDLLVWQVDHNYALDDEVYYQGNVYRSMNDVGTTGTTPPTHTEGEGQDGGGGVWLYLHSGYGLARITAVTNSTTATATLITTMPIQMIGAAGATYRWTRAAYGEDLGWPIAVTFFRERLVLAGERRIDMSVVSDFEFFNRRIAGQFEDDLAIAVRIASGRVDGIEWLAADTSGLVIGTRGQEFLIDEAATNAPFGSSNFRIRPQSQYGSQTNAEVAQVGDTLAYVNRTGTQLLTAQYDIGASRLVSQDISIYSQHIAAIGIVDIAFQQQPYNILWARRTDNTLVAWSFDRVNGIIAGHRHPMTNAEIESICVIPSPDGSKDDVWLFTARNIDNVVVRYVEILVFSEPELTGVTSSFFVDCGLQLFSGSPVSILSGLDHLKGQTVAVLGDGAVLDNEVVSDTGQITISVPSQVVAVGIPMTSRLRTMRVEAGAADGTAQGRLKRVHRAVVRFINTLGGKIGSAGDLLDVIPNRAGTSTIMDQPPPVFDGDINVVLPGGWNRAGYVTLVQDQPTAMTVNSITLIEATND